MENDNGQNQNQGHGQQQRWGEKTQGQREVQPLRNSDLIRDSRQLFIFKKTEKIVSAIFLISESFSHSVPQLSIQMRDHAMTLLKKTLAVKSLVHFEVHEVEGLIKDYLFLRSLFAVAHQTRLISDTNFSIVEFEMAGVLARLRSIIETPLSDAKSDVLERDFFSIEDIFERNPEAHPIFDTHHDQAEPEVSFIGHDLYERHQKDIDNAKKKAEKDIRDNLQQSPQNKPHIQNSPQNTPKSTAKKPSPQARPVQVDDKESRLETITELLRENGESSIKDIYDHFDGVSEKTIQRDLQTLVVRGIVIKEGEKRWSRYRSAR